MNYLLVSDLHLHSWSAFSATNEDGVNSRLQIIMDELLRACYVHAERGGDKRLVIAGDIFHSRGAVQTSVLNAVMDLFQEIKIMGFSTYILSGNHDLESKDSRRLSSSVTSLEPFAQAYSDSLVNEVLKVVFVPWFHDVKALKEELERITIPDREIYDLIIHAPIDDVIIGLPSHGLDATYLAGLGFKRVFSGHYHNHKDFGNGVWSIGASTHQKFSDIGSKAGFISVFEDKVIWNASHAPKFVDVNEDNFEDAELLADGNYVRCKIAVAKESDVLSLRKQFEDWGAKGVIINQIKSTTVTPRGGVAIASESTSLEQSVSAFVKSKGYDEKVEKLSLEILTEAGGVE